jgi:hypothetical protein
MGIGGASSIETTTPDRQPSKDPIAAHLNNDSNEPYRAPQETGISEECGESH